MKTIKIGNKAIGFTRIKFLSEYSEMTMIELCEWMKTASNLHECRERVSQLVRQINDLDLSQSSLAMLDELKEQQLRVLDLQFVALCKLCRHKGFSSFIYEHSSIDYAKDIPFMYDAVTEDLVSFNDWFDDLPAVKSFSRSFRAYEVPSMDSVSTWRAHQAQSKWSRISRSVKDLSSGDLLGFLSIAAYCIRPKWQQKDYGLLKGRCFVTFKEVKGLDEEEKLTYFAEKLRKQHDANLAMLKGARASIVIGLCKSFFAEMSKTSNAYNSGLPSQSSTPESAKYHTVFGMRTTITALSEITNEKSSALWLHTVEDFYIHVLERNLRAEAQEAEYERQQQINKTLSKHSKA